MLKELKEAGYTCHQAKLAGYTCYEIGAAGYRVKDAKKAGYTLEEIKDGYTATVAKAAGYTLAEMKAAGYVQGLKEAGFTVVELKAAGYVYITPIFWHKTGQTSTTTKKQFTRAVEMVIVGCKTRGDGFIPFTNMDVNPENRHNYLEGPPLRKYLRHTDGTKVNPTQKPPYLFKWIHSRLGTPGLPMVIMGSGAGGEVGACVELGVSVVAIEQDLKQVQALHNHLITFEARARQVEEEDEAKFVKGMAADAKRTAAARTKALEDASAETAPVLSAAAPRPLAPSPPPASASADATSAAPASPASPAAAEEATPASASAEPPVVPEEGAQKGEKAQKE